MPPTKLQRSEAERGDERRWSVQRESVRSIGWLGVTSLPRNLGLDERRKLCERLLPAEIAHLERNGLG